MAKTIKYSSLKRGDTPVFAFTFTAPTAGYSWAGVQADFAMTVVAAPTDNTGAAAKRINQAVNDNGNGTATFSVQLTTAESNALIPNSDYTVEVQLKEGGGAN